MEALLNIGTIDRKRIFIEIDFNEEENTLRITGTVGANSCGNADECGQIDEMLRNRYRYINFQSPWNPIKFGALLMVWRAYHRNDMCAGNEEQSYFLGSNPPAYDIALQILDEVGLNEPYRYGSQWLKREIPPQIKTYLFNLPRSNIKHPWSTDR